MSIQFKRGTQAKVDAETTTLLKGQPLFATDTGELTIGTADSQSPNLGRKFVPIELKKEKECDLTLTSRSGTWTSPISDLGSDVSGFVWEATVQNTNYSNIGHNPPPSWTGLIPPTSVTAYYCAVKIPAGAAKSPFGGGDNYLKVQHLVSGSNYATTYFKFSTYSTSIPTSDCYLIINAPNPLPINTSNITTPKQLNVFVSAVQEVGSNNYISREAGYTYYDGEKLVAKSNFDSGITFSSDDTCYLAPAEGRGGTFYLGTLDLITRAGGEGKIRCINIESPHPQLTLTSPSGVSLDSDECSATLDSSSFNLTTDGETSGTKLSIKVSGGDSSNNYRVISWYHSDVPGTNKDQLNIGGQVNIMSSGADGTPYLGMSRSPTSVGRLNLAPSTIPCELAVTGQVGTANQVLMSQGSGKSPKWASGQDIKFKYSDSMTYSTQIRAHNGLTTNTQVYLPKAADGFLVASDTDPNTAYSGTILMGQGSGSVPKWVQALLTTPTSVQLAYTAAGATTMTSKSYTSYSSSYSAKKLKVNDYYIISGSVISDIGSDVWWRIYASGYSIQQAFVTCYRNNLSGNYPGIVTCSGNGYYAYVGLDASGANGFDFMLICQ